jgi:hypothetical protein
MPLLLQFILNVFRAVYVKIRQLIIDNPMIVFFILFAGVLWSLNLHKSYLIVIAVYGSILLLSLGFDDASQWLFNWLVP